MNVAIFGGTFDPIHNAHLLVAREALRAFALDRVVFIPAGSPPHKLGTDADYPDRVRMVELAVEGEPRFEVSRIEQGSEKSYSIHTIEKMARPGQRLFFVIGADAFAELQTWYRWRDVAGAVEFIVVTRPGHGYEIPPGVTAHTLDTVDMPVSSSEIRRDLAEGKTPDALPQAVAAYIARQGLYRLAIALGHKVGDGE